jgi:DNA-directed RNA polymerase specialized sigma24 family protein
MVPGDKPDASELTSSDNRESQETQRERQRLHDEARLRRIAECGWTGREYEELREELAAHGLAVLMSLTRSGEIAARCTKFGRPIRILNRDGEIFWTYDDRRSIVNITVAIALVTFIEKILKNGQWKADRGASLKTFFAHWCERQFPNHFNAWSKGQKRWDEIHDFNASPEDREAELPPQENYWPDPTTAEYDAQQAKDKVLASIDKPEMRIAAIMRSEGYSLREISSEINLSENVISNRFSRMRSKQRFNPPVRGPET